MWHLTNVFYGWWKKFFKGVILIIFFYVVAWVNTHQCRRKAEFGTKKTQNMHVLILAIKIVSAYLVSSTLFFKKNMIIFSNSISLAIDWRWQLLFKVNIRWFIMVRFLWLMLRILCCRLWFLWSDDDITNKQGRNKCGCLGGCKFFAGTCSGLEFFKLDEMTPSTSSAHSTMNAELEMFYGQSLLQPNEWIITKDTSKTIDGNF